jgi:hypothetical protein
LKIANDLKSSFVVNIGGFHSLVSAEDYTRNEQSGVLSLTVFTSYLVNIITFCLSCFAEEFESNDRNGPLCNAREGRTLSGH